MNALRRIALLIVLLLAPLPARAIDIETVTSPGGITAWLIQDHTNPLISLAFVKMIESLRAFDLIYVMTSGGPGIATETLDMYAFSQGFIESTKPS